MDVAELVGRTLARLGVAQAFGVVGSGNFHVTNALRTHGVPFVATRHEAGAATAADAYARTTGRVAVVSTHQGCGFSNALTGITEAAKSRTPLIVLTADTAAGAVLSNFDVDQDGLARAVGAVPMRVHGAASAVADTVRAYRTAVTQRRTVVLNLPQDVQALPAPGDEPAVLPPVEPAAQVRPDAGAVAALAELVAASSRPVFVAGRGALAAREALCRLADECGALLATSAVANGLFHGEPWSLGISGGFASPLAAELITGADLVIGWGCALNMWTMRHGALVGPGARVAQVDVEQAALGAHRPVVLGVLGDARLVAEDLRAELGARGHTGTGYRCPQLRARLADGVRWNDVALPDESTPDAIDPRVLSRRLDELLPAQRVVAVDSGNFMGYPSAYLAVPDQRGFCFTQAYQSIGLGLATALGAAVASPDRLPVAALGDGGFQMSLVELDTVVRLGIPMLIVIYNDAAYGAEVHHFSGGADLSTVRFPDTDLARVGRGFGCAGVTVRSVADLDAVAEWLAGPRDRPLLVDAKVADIGPSWWLAEAFGH
ncbi:MAG TPA: thiamine pyrophosphate-binding protein [Pseudonocardia sp.]|uniref:thiamine pyrophosphate-binding protein n=1 Tax=Pseudonocardia sp. TaxID=60912 RepID=UPI002F4275D1